MLLLWVGCAIAWRSSIIPASSDVHNHVDNAARFKTIHGNNWIRRALPEMDDLLKRADRAIEDSHRARDQARQHLGRARVATAEIRRTLQRARAEGVRSRQLGREATESCGVSRETSADRSPCAASDQGAPDRTYAPGSTDPDRSH
jgi:hypothetical protein